MGLHPRTFLGPLGRFALRHGQHIWVIDDIRWPQIKTDIGHRQFSRYGLFADAELIIVDHWFRSSVVIIIIGRNKSAVLSWSNIGVPGYGVSKENCAKSIFDLEATAIVSSISLSVSPG